MFGFLSFSDLSTTIAGGIDRVPLGVEIVVGIPRSGMIPAYMIGLYRNIAVIDLPSFLSGAVPQKGFRKLEKERANSLEASWILLVDDSISTGRAMEEAIAKIAASGYAGRVTTCAVVAEPSRKKYVDIHFCEIPNPRLFEWNAFHRPDIIENACFDLDGVLCVDPTNEENDDGPRYREFLLNARPKFRSTLTIGNIVSARLEKYRDLTEQWLADNHVSYGELHLINLPSAQERIRLNAYCPHKAKVYIESKAAIFFESDPEQAAEIARLANRPVLCTEDMKIYLPGIRVGSAPGLLKWRLAKPIGRVRAKLRILLRPFGIDLDTWIAANLRAGRKKR